VVLIVALTIASFAYNEATGGREQPASALYAGPFVSVDGTRVAYRRWGASGSPIVLVGGFVEPSWVWEKVGPLLGRNHRVVAVDLPPFGYTLRRGPYTLAHWVELVRDVSTRLDLVQPLVVGHSLGAAVAVDDALEHPHGVSGVVLLDGDALPVGGPHWLAYLALDPFYTSVFRIATGSDWIVGHALRSALGPNAPKQSHAALERWEKPSVSRARRRRSGSCSSRACRASRWPTCNECPCRASSCGAQRTRSTPLPPAARRRLRCARASS
jgi:pimeloyl-ACP methyl ester carboxylesterase